MVTIVQGKGDPFCTLLEHLSLIMLLISHYCFCDQLHISLWEDSGHPDIPISARIFVVCLDQVIALSGFASCLGRTECTCIYHKHVVEVPDMRNVAVPTKDKVHLAAVQKFEHIACVNQDSVFPASQRNTVLHQLDREII